MALWFIIWSCIAWGFQLNISGLEGVEPKAHIQWLGENIELKLHQEGRFWIAEHQGPPVRYANLKIRIHDNETLFSGLLPLYQGQEEIWIDIDQRHKRGQILSGPGPSKSQDIVEQRWIAGRASWFCLFILLIAIWSLLPRKEHSENSPPQKLILGWYSFPLWLIVSAIWNGPALWKTGIPGLHHDAPGTLWVLGSVQYWEGFFHPHTGWPAGINYGQLDSYLLFLIAGLGFSPIWIHKAFLLLGPTLSAWAAERFAREMGAEQPWSLLAGLGYMFCGLSAGMALEGNVYQLLQPWLPLCALMWWKANSTEGKAIHGVLTAGFFMLCMLTSAYLGLGAALLIGIFWLGHRGWRFSATWWALLVALPLIGIFVFGYTTTAELGKEQSHRALLIGSSNPANLLGHTPELDRAGHSLSLGLLAVPFALAWLSLLVGAGKGKMVLWVTAFCSLLLSFGSHFSINSADPLFPLPLQWIRQLPLLSSLTFPLRLAWPFLLCTGVLAALAATAIAKRRKGLHWLLALAFLEAWVSPMLFLRQGNYQPVPPSVFQQSQGPIFHLFPQVLPFSRGDDPHLQFTAMACMFQLQHQQPIAENCMATDPQKQPRTAILQEIYKQLNEGKWQESKLYLKKLGFLRLAVFPDLYTDGDRHRVLSMLAHIDPNPIESKDGGLWTRIYRLDVPSQEHISQQAVTTQQLRINYFPTRRIQGWQVEVEGKKELLEPVSLNSTYRVEFQGKWQKPLPIRILDQQGKIQWSGVFKPGSKVDEWTIGDGLQVVAPIQSSPGTMAKNGKAALWGWGAIGSFLGLMLWGWRRKRSKILSDNSNAHG